MAVVLRFETMPVTDSMMDCICWRVSGCTFIVTEQFGVPGSVMMKFLRSKSRATLLSCCASTLTAPVAFRVQIPDASHFSLFGNPCPWSMYEVKEQAEGVPVVPLISDTAWSNCMLKRL